MSIEGAPRWNLLQRAREAMSLELDNRNGVAKERLELGGRRDGGIRAGRLWSRGNGRDAGCRADICNTLYLAGNGHGVQPVSVAPN